MKTTTIILLLIIAAVSGVTLSVYVHRNDLKPRPRTYHYPIDFVAQMKKNPHPAKEVFLHFCASCHAKNPSIRVGAPRIGNKEDWQPIKETYTKKQIIDFTLEGHNAMPARGGCFECSDELILKTIHYMMEKS